MLTGRGRKGKVKVVRLGWTARAPVEDEKGGSKSRYGWSESKDIREREKEGKKGKRGGWIKCDQARDEGQKDTKKGKAPRVDGRASSSHADAVICSN